MRKGTRRRGEFRAYSPWGESRGITAVAERSDPHGDRTRLVTPRAQIRTRKASLPDAASIHALILGYSREGTLLPRTLSEICENVRDFTVVERHGEIIGCGALHLYGLHLAEVRSIAVAKSAQKMGAGSKLIGALLDEAQDHSVSQVCLFT